jgi:hypothetical protein
MLSMEEKVAAEEDEEETLYILHNESLMAQIERSLVTHRNGTGFRPSEKELSWEED